MLFKSQEMVLELAVQSFNLVDIVGLDLTHQVFLRNLQPLIDSQLNS